MANYLATWFYSSPPGEQIYYPGVGSNSDDWLFKKAYWHCILTFFHRFNSIYRDAASRPRLLLFLNSPPPFEEIRFQIDLHKFFEANTVQTVFFKTAFNGVDKQTVFATQFHIYDVLSAAHDFMMEGDTITLLDSDVLPLAKIPANYFDELLQFGYSYYPVEWPSSLVNNGITLERFLQALLECASYFGEAASCSDAINALQAAPFYLGGELIGYSKSGLGKFLAVIDAISEFALRESSCAIATEEQLNTIGHCLLGDSFVDASNIIRRVWTDRSKFRNVLETDKNLCIAHLPGEKLNGFYKYYHEVILGSRASGDERVLNDTISPQWLWEAFRM